MRLNKNDEEILKSWGYSKEDIEGIKMSVGKTTYTFDGKKISADKSVLLLGRETFLSGLSRSTFHYSCGRTENGNTVSFNSSKLYE